MNGKERVMTKNEIIDSLEYLLSQIEDDDAQIFYTSDEVEAVREAISIVKALAEEHKLFGNSEQVNNDFCEWKLDGVYLHHQHDTELFISCLEEEKYRYNYCPICGKKIKVVE